MNKRYLTMLHDLLKYAIVTDRFNLTSRQVSEWSNEILEASEKQMPMKVSNIRTHTIGDSRIRYHNGNCPVCETYIEDNSIYCINCGQKLDWEE